MHKKCLVLVSQSWVELSWDTIQSKQRDRYVIILTFALMLTISNRGNQMPPSPIRKLVPYAEAAKKKGIKVYHLNIGQPDIETPPAILDAVRNADIKVLEYSHSAGNESYRRKLVQYYKSVAESFSSHSELNFLAALLPS